MYGSDCNSRGSETGSRGEMRIRINLHRRRTGKKAFEDSLVEARPFPCLVDATRARKSGEEGWKKEGRGGNVRGVKEGGREWGEREGRKEERGEMEGWRARRVREEEGKKGGKGEGMRERGEREGKE